MFRDAVSRSLLALVLLCPLACASMRPEPPPPTRYRVGDYVVYQYTGSFTPEPVTLHEQVIEQRGNRLTIDDVATRGQEQRHWIQVVTDTPENQQKNVVDELYEVVGSERRRLANVNNADLYRLYDWTYLVPDDAPTDLETSRGSLEIAGKNFKCAVNTGLVGWHGKTLRFRNYECPEFLWTHGGTRYWDNHFGDSILRGDVTEFGNVNAKPAGK